MKITKFAFSFFILCLISSIHVSYAREFMYEEVHSLLKNSIPGYTNSKDYCRKRSEFLRDAIESLKSNESLHGNVGSAKDFVLRFLIKSIDEYYTEGPKCYCRMEESVIISESSSFKELLCNLSTMKQVYNDLGGNGPYTYIHGGWF